MKTTEPPKILKPQPIDYRQRAIENARAIRAGTAAIKPNTPSPNQYVATDWPAKGDQVDVSIEVNGDVGSFVGTFAGYLHIGQRLFIRLDGEMGGAAFPIDRVVTISVEEPKEQEQDGETDDVFDD